MATLDDVAGLRGVTEDVVTLAQRDAAVALRSVDLQALSADRPRLERAVGEVIYGYGYGLSSIAADWYADARAASPAVGRYVPVAVTALTEEQLATLVGWSLGPLYAEEPDLRLAVARLDGGVQRTVANSARQTIVDNTRRDTTRPSYYRGASANCCSFCAVLTTRTYRLEASAGFDAHDHDRCFPVPVWPGEAAPLPPYYADFQDAYDEAAKAARRAGEPVVMPHGTQRRDTILWRIRERTGRK